MPIKFHVKNDKIVVSIFQFFMLHAEYKCSCIYIKMTLGHKIGNMINIINMLRTLNNLNNPILEYIFYYYSNIDAKVHARILKFMLKMITS